MAKYKLTESEMIKLVEEATKSALSKILNEGAGWDTMKQSFRKGLEGWGVVDLDNDDPKSMASNYIQNGDGVNYSDFDRNREMYNTARDKNVKSDIATDMIGSRPGIIGKAQRAANVKAYNAGKFIKNKKDKATNFIHNNIGLEENKQ